MEIDAQKVMVDFITKVQKVCKRRDMTFDIRVWDAPSTKMKIEGEVHEFHKGTPFALTTDEDVYLMFVHEKGYIEPTQRQFDKLDDNSSSVKWKKLMADAAKAPAKPATEKPAPKAKTPAKPAGKEGYVKLQSWPLGRRGKIGTLVSDVSGRCGILIGGGRNIQALVGGMRKIYLDWHTALYHGIVLEGLDKTSDHSLQQASDWMRSAFPDNLLNNYTGEEWKGFKAPSFKEDLTGWEILERSPLGAVSLELAKKIDSKFVAAVVARDYKTLAPYSVDNISRTGVRMLVQDREASPGEAKFAIVTVSKVDFSSMRARMTGERQLRVKDNKYIWTFGGGYASTGYIK